MRSLNYEELYGLYSLPNIIWVQKPRTMRLAGHVARMEDRKDAYRGLILIYLLTAIGLTHSGSIIARIYTQTIHRTTQLMTFIGMLSGIRNQSGQNKINGELTA